MIIEKDVNKLVIASLLMGLISTNGLVFAQAPPSDTQSTPSILPDSPFYGLKTVIENLQAAFTFNDTAKAEFEIKLAQKRLAEIQAELQKGDQLDAQKAQKLHDDEVDDVEKIADKQDNDDHGQKVKTYVHQLIADHEQNIGKLVSQFAQNSTKMEENSSSTILQNIKSTTDRIRQNHGDNEQPNPNVHASHNK